MIMLTTPKTLMGIVKKIFELFLKSGGKFIKQNVNSVTNYKHK